MPADYGNQNKDKDTYVQSWKETKDGFTTDGLIDADGLKTVLDIQALIKDDVAKHKDAIKLSDVYTTEFVQKVPSS